ncbi:DUF2955 domain-containing protein, partial [Pseudomonas aeruginosa]|uniref:DUF2955 domain-containing protein n=1 Tax=Pseudomonas aeruginosa TaxID=287 RepID=UPI00396869BD
MSANDLRQCLRIAGGGTLGFFVCKLMNWDYGSFFGVISSGRSPNNPYSTSTS